MTEVVVGGCGLGALFGLGMGILSAMWPMAGRVARPYVVASQAVPKLALAPLLVVWLGFGLAPRIVITALLSFFPLFEATVFGLGSTDPEQRDLFRSLRATLSFAAQGLAVEILTWDPSPEVLTAGTADLLTSDKEGKFTRGEVDVYGACEWGLIKRIADLGTGRITGMRRNMGMPMKLFVPPAESQVASIADLAGRPVAMNQHSGSHYVALEVMEPHMPREQIRLVHIGEPFGRYQVRPPVWRQPSSRLTADRPCAGRADARGVCAGPDSRFARPGRSSTGGGRIASRGSDASGATTLAAHLLESAARRAGQPVCGPGAGLLPGRGAGVGVLARQWLRRRAQAAHCWQRRPGVRRPRSAVLPGGARRRCSRGVCHVPTQMFVLASHPDTNIQTPQDLRGKKIGVLSLASGGRYNLLTMLYTHGLKESDVTVVATGASPAAFIAREVDVWSTIDSGLWLAQQAGLGEVHQLRVRDTLDLPTDVLAVRRPLLEQHPDLLARMLRPIKRGTEFMLAQRDKSADIGARNGRDVKDPARVRAVLDFFAAASQSPNGLGVFDLEVLSRGADAYHATGLVKQPLDVASLFTNQVVLNL